MPRTPLKGTTGTSGTLQKHSLIRGNGAEKLASVPRAFTGGCPSAGTPKALVLVKQVVCPWSCRAGRVACGRCERGMSHAPGTFPEVLGEGLILAASRSIIQIGNLATLPSDTQISAPDKYWQGHNHACESS